MMMDSKGGGEVRRIHIIYFLSRTGRIEHPHLIRVLHLARGGVHLRDVKRWLAEMRGKNMPDAFAWSYKRRYKTGYVWQDLLDDDLITPTSDNEYVLKGCEISSSRTVCIRTCCMEKSHLGKLSDPTSPEKKAPEDLAKSSVAIKLHDYGKRGKEEELAGKGAEFCSSSSSSSFSSSSSSLFAAASSEASKEGKADGGRELGGASRLKGGKSRVRGLRGLLSCGVVDTNDAAILRGGGQSKEVNGDRATCGLGGSARFFSGYDWFRSNEAGERRCFSDLKGLNRKKNDEQNDKQMKSAVAFMPVSEPNCSQCGKGFKPEKLQAHMKSCKGLKSRVGKKKKKGSFAATEKPSPNAMTEKTRKRTIGFFLRNSPL